MSSLILPKGVAGFGETFEGAKPFPGRYSYPRFLMLDASAAIRWIGRGCLLEWLVGRLVGWLVVWPLAIFRVSTLAKTPDYELRISTWV